MGLVTFFVKFTAYKYLYILQNIMIPNVRAIYPEREIIYLVKNNSPIYKAKIVQTWFKEKNIYYYNRFTCIISWLKYNKKDIWKLVTNDENVMKKRNNHKQNLKDHVIKMWKSFRLRPDLMLKYRNSMSKKLFGKYYTYF